ncbi:MAG TPA: sulfotransferase [Solirubrobacteraceae bacterium]|jgi:hypothetical protein|nr:sulfotransferase [Solirubrobacteraceae bacterium]
MISPQALLKPRGESAPAIPVVLIACAGRSGSTLLDRIIGAHRGFFSAGELRFIWERSFGENQLCGCGTPFDECDFWADVSRSTFGVAPAEVDATTAMALRASLDETRYAPWLIQGHSPAAYKSSLLVYSCLIERLYEQILRISGDRVIVDSSGDATHGLILSRVPGIELHVIHLVRDPRAVAFSWKRKRRRPEIHWAAEDIPIEPVRTSATRWMMHNLLAERLSRSAASYRRVRYEDFVVGPEATVAELLEPLGLAGGPDALAAGEIVLAPSHTVSGNPMRFTHGPVKIRIDDEWRRSMSLSDHRTVTAITWPLLKKYGYAVRRSA